MGIAVSPIGAGISSLKCRICGRKASRGEKLCDECIAAVKRARHVPMVSSEFLPQPVARTAGASASGARQIPVARPRAGIRRWLPTRASGWGALVAFAIFGATVCVTGFYAVQEIDDDALRAQSRAPETAVPAALPRVAPASETALVVTPTIPDPPLDLAPTDYAAIPETPARVPAKPAARKSIDAKGARRAVPPPDTRNSGTGEADTIARAQEPAASTSPADSGTRAVVQEQPVIPDRWQAMNDALARCSREGFLASVVCTERARMQFCEGYWGAVPQCRGAARADNTR